MAEIKQPQKVLVFAGLIYQKDFLVDDLLKAMGVEFGEVAQRSKVIPFTHTDYYCKEMGKDLLRQWFVFDKLIKPDVLADLKHHSNEIEKKYLNENAGRTVNIDPGLITMSNLILASTKNYAHRIYIGRGIYGEVTMIFKNHEFRPLDWTYPDYEETVALDFFQDARSILKEKLTEYQE